eukprot:scaffold263806_cov19-Tisochrysis_lutea.AAC.2
MLVLLQSGALQQKMQHTATSTLEMLGPPAIASMQQLCAVRADWKVVDRVLQGLREAGERHGKTPTEVALNWVMARYCIPTCTPVCTDTGHSKNRQAQTSLKIIPHAPVHMEVQTHTHIHMHMNACTHIIRRGAIPIPGAKLADQARMNDGSMDWSLTNDEVEHLASLGEDGKTSHWQHG